MGAPHGAVAAAGAQELPLEEEGGEALSATATGAPHSRRGKPLLHVSPTLEKNQAFQPKQSKTLRLQASKKKFRVRGKLPGPNRRDKKRDGEGGGGW